MADFYNKYKNRVKRKGNNVGEAYANNTIAFIDSNFHASPTFKVAQVVSSRLPNISEIDIRVTEVERMGSLREVLFRPNESLPIGSYVKFDDEVWLITDIWKSYEYQNRALVQKCNHKLKWATENSWTNIDGSINSDKIIEFDCIASQSSLGSKASQGRFELEFNKYDVTLPSGQLLIFVEKNDLTTNIRLNDRFIFGDTSVYQVIGVDDVSLVFNDYGIIQLTTKITTIQSRDDFKNYIAFNEYENNENSNEESNVEEEVDEGGRLW